MKAIGVITIDPSFIVENHSLLEDLQYFDQIVYSISREHLGKFFSQLPGFEEMFMAKITELDRLTSAGLTIEFNKQQIKPNWTIQGVQTALKYSKAALNISSQFIPKGSSPAELFSDFFCQFNLVSQLESRTNAIYLNHMDSHAYTPIIRNNLLALPQSEPSSNTMVLSVLLKKLPQISKDTSLEQLVEFKSDPDSQLKLARLRDWVLEMGRKDYSPREIEQKIEYLLQEYESQLELHKLKYNLGAIETIISVSLEFLENVATLKFSQAAKALFDLRRQEFSLMEAEKSLTGRELAFLHKLSQSPFSDKNSAKS